MYTQYLPCLNSFEGALTPSLLMSFLMDASDTFNVAATSDTTMSLWSMCCLNHHSLLPIKGLQIIVSPLGEAEVGLGLLERHELLGLLIDDRVLVHGFLKLLAVDHPVGELGCSTTVEGL